jgi:hypothetical protein
MGFTSIPVARSQGVNVNEGGSVIISLDGFDPMDLPLSYLINVQPSNGDIFRDGSRVVYTPKPDFVGNDGFVYSVNNGLRSSSSATVNIIVKPTQSTVLSISRISFDSNELVLNAAAGKGLKCMIDSSRNLLDWKQEAVFIGGGISKPVKVTLKQEFDINGMYWRVR